MKKWNNADIEVLSLGETKQGKSLSTHVDDTWVDQNGHYWDSYASGVATIPNSVDGTMTGNN